MPGRESVTLSLKSFHIAATTVKYCHFVNDVIASRQMGNIQTEGILYKNGSTSIPLWWVFSTSFVSAGTVLSTDHTAVECMKTFGRTICCCKLCQVADSNLLFGNSCSYIIYQWSFFICLLLITRDLQLTHQCPDKQSLVGHWLVWQEIQVLISVWLFGRLWS